MTVQQLFSLVRLYIKDTQKTKFSDYELLNILNEVISIVSYALSESGSYVIKREINILPVNGEIDLPSDFDGIVSITFKGEPVQYTLLENKIKVINADTMIYKFSLPLCESITSVVPMSVSISEMVKRYMTSLLLNEISFDKLKPLIIADVSQKFTGREYDYLEIPIPFELGR